MRTRTYTIVDGDFEKTALAAVQAYFTESRGKLPKAIRVQLGVTLLERLEGSVVVPAKRDGDAPGKKDYSIVIRRDPDIVDGEFCLRVPD